MTELTKLKTKGDYSEHVFNKMVDGKPVEVVDIDAMSEEQWQKFCRDTGTEHFKRLNAIVSRYEILATQQDGYPCSPHCAGYLRELEQRKEVERLRAALTEAAETLETCRYSEQPLARKLRVILNQQERKEK